MLEHMEQVLERKMSLEVQEHMMVLEQVLEHMMGLEQVLERKELVPERMEQVLEYMMAMEQVLEHSLEIRVHN